SPLIELLDEVQIQREDACLVIGSRRPTHDRESAALREGAGLEAQAESAKLILDIVPPTSEPQSLNHDLLGHTCPIVCDEDVGCMRLKSQMDTDVGRCCRDRIVDQVSIRCWEVVADIPQ